MCNDLAIINVVMFYVFMQLWNHAYFKLEWNFPYFKLVWNLAYLKLALTAVFLAKWHLWSNIYFDGDGFEHSYLKFKICFYPKECVILHNTTSSSLKYLNWVLKYIKNS